MHVWTVSEPKVVDFRHKLETSHGHALMVPILTWTFERLGIGASLFDGRLWWPIHSAATLVSFELEHGVEVDRWAYNDRCFAQVRKTKRSVRGEHAGQTDLFVPVILEGDVVGVLVVGPFVTERPKSIDVLDRWHTWTGRQGHPRDPSFMAFVRATLSLLVLEGDRPRQLKRMVECLADLLASRGRADALANEAYALRLALEPARAVDRFWDAARMMVDERFSQAHYSGARAFEMRQVGLQRAPDHVLVGLAASGKANLDPVEALFARDALQRSVTKLAQDAGDVVAGPVGDNGVAFLGAVKGPPSEKKKKLLALGTKAAAIAKDKYGLTLHLGASLGSGASPLYRTYREALAAAEAALTSGRKLVIFGKDAPQPVHRLGELRDELERSAEAGAGSLPAKFDRYVEVLAARANYRLEPAHAELMLLLERLTAGMLRSGALDARSVADMREEIDRAASEAATLEEIFATYRRAIADLASAAAAPVAARRDRGLRGALEYVRQHYAEPLPLAKIARLAVLHPSTFRAFSGSARRSRSSATSSDFASSAPSTCSLAPT